MTRIAVVGAAETGMRHTRGEVVFVQDMQEPTHANDLKRLWRLRHRHDSLIAHRRTRDSAVGPNLLDRIRAWQSGKRPYAPLGLQMIRREAAEQWRRDCASESDRDGARLRADMADERRSPKFMTRLRDFALGE